MTTSGTGVRVRRVSAEQCVEQLLELLGDTRALVVGTPAALRRTRAADVLPAGTAVFHAFTPNPTTDQALAAARARSAHGAELVVGIGGGSAMDVAKAARVLPADPVEATEVLARRRRPPEPSPGLVLVPTTAGSGSEVTSFATLYDGHRKVSLDDDRVRAEDVLIATELLATCPPDVLWSGTLDTVAHAIESMWSMRSDPTSRERAGDALARIAPVLARPELAGVESGREALSHAGSMAGEAIDRTRTTAAHALAYPLTAYLGLAHGYAVAATLRWLVPLVTAVGDSAVRDPRGPDVPRGAVHAAAAALGVDGPAGIVSTIDAALARCRPPRFTAARLDAVLDRLVTEGLSSERLAGMPVHLDADQVRSALRQSLGELVQIGGTGA
ncbi:iron-containing alcohol dehydrogenase [Pseudonocardia sp. TRM90224]|uniref:iron-containing alcohol dehydrogenase n=1 Tax=Pseudonocardia sp. TRM90224 TaxID=2812678 RepID=UPI001E417F09|nr:iron-containing alcohol dehydrogenase [Pseudonocardia sp. TRM90224]